VQRDATHLSWIDLKAGSISSVPNTGGAAQQVAAADWVGGLPVDATHVYFTEEFKGTVKRVPLGGGPIETIATLQSDRSRSPSMASSFTGRTRARSLAKELSCV
jgi:hypothetical protein